MKCPLCGNDYLKCIYYGFPIKLCVDEECSCMFGFWSNILQYLPFNGEFMSYTGNYFIAVIVWLSGITEDE